MNKKALPTEPINKTEPTGLPLVLDDTVNPLQDSLNEVFIYGKLGGPRAFWSYKLGKHLGGVLDGSFESLKRLKVPCYIFDRKFVLSFACNPRYSPTIQSIYVRFVKKG